MAKQMYFTHQHTSTSSQMGVPLPSLKLTYITPENRPLGVQQIPIGNHHFFRATVSFIIQPTPFKKNHLFRRKNNLPAFHSPQTATMIAPRYGTFIPGWMQRSSNPAGSSTGWASPRERWRRPGWRSSSTSPRIFIIWWDVFFFKTRQTGPRYVYIYIYSKCFFWIVWLIVFFVPQKTP